MVHSLGLGKRARMDSLPFSRFEPKLGEVILAMSIGVILLFALVLGITRTNFAAEGAQPAANYPIERLGQVLLGRRPGRTSGEPGPSGIW